MGAEEFITYAEGREAPAAFRQAVEAAQWEYGHGGYTGTIAEKDGEGFVIVTEGPMPMTEARAFAERMLREDNRLVTDKWGPCGAIPVKADTRTVEVTGLSGIVPDWGATPRAEFTEVVMSAAHARGLVKVGEEAISADLQTYDTVSATQRVGHGVITRRRVQFTNGTVTLIVRRTTEDLDAQTTPDGWLFFGVASS